MLTPLHGKTECLAVQTFVDRIRDAKTQRAFWLIYALALALKFEPAKVVERIEIREVKEEGKTRDIPQQLIRKLMELLPKRISLPA